MTKPIYISKNSWFALKSQLKKDHKFSTIMIRKNLKEKLGFLPREYTEWDPENKRSSLNCIVLDFYDDKKQTLFLLKYSSFLKEV